MCGVISGFAGLRKTALLVCGGRDILSPRGRGRVVVGPFMFPGVIIVDKSTIIAL